MKNSGKYATVLIIGGMLPVSAAVSASSFTLDPIVNHDIGSGCFFSDLKTKEQIFIVASNSRPNHKKGIGIVRIGGKQYTLDLIEQHRKKIDIYEGAGIRIEITDWEETGQACKTSECEGSFYHAIMKVVKGSDAVRLKVHAHCGA